MKEDKQLNVLTANVTQGSANANVEQSINLGISSRERIIMAIHQVVFDADYLEYPASGNALTAMQMLLASETGITGSYDLTDKEVIAMCELIAQLGNGANLTPTIREKFSQGQVFTPKEPILYPFNTLYFVLGSSGQANAKTAKVKVYYKWVKISEQEYIDLLEFYNSLV